MSEDNTSKEDGITTKNNLTRRDLALTSLAMGAAAVLPATAATQAASSTTEPGASSSTEAGASSNRSGWKRGGTIPAEYYLDEKWYLRDEAYLKQNYWWVVDHEDRISQPGDYFLFQFGRGDSLIIARDDNGGVNAFHNVCRHRGSRVCLHNENLPSEAGPGGKRPDAVFSVRQLGQEGNTSVFRCPYHAWTYDLTGKLVSVPGAAKFAPAGFNLADHSLHPAHVRLAGGFIFVSLAAGAAPEFQVPVGGVEPKLKVAARRTHHVKGNWKLVLENFTECYHCGPAHSNSYSRGDWVGDETLTPAQVAALGGNYDDYLAAALHGYTWKPDKTQVAPSGGMGARGRHQAGSAVNYGLPLRPGQVAMTTDGKPACAKLLPGYTERLGPSPGPWAAEAGGLLSFMNGVIPSPDYALIWRFIPRAVDKTDADLVWLVHPDAEEGKDYDVEHLVALWNNTVREDRWVVENNHVGLSNSRYSSGQPYMPSEGGLVNITDFYMNQMVPAMLRAETKKA
jgi:Rieske 2Fe-2S family protein